MAGAALAFQKIAFDALTAPTPIVGGRIYDVVPDRAEYPFISFDGGESLDRSGTSSADGDTEVSLTLNIWSQQDGWLEADTIAEAVYARLHRTSLAQSAGHGCVFNYERDRGHIRDPDGRTRRIICRYRAILERL